MSALAETRLNGGLLLFRRLLRESFRRLQTGGGHIVQKAVAAGMAWWLATFLLGHQQPSFAAIAAIISLGATAGREGRQAVELVFGVTCGLGVADLFVSAIGVGPAQIGVVVAIATAVALLLGKGELLVNEAAISALLMIALVPASSGPFTARLLDALIGSGMALAVRAIFPNNPKRAVERVAHPTLEELAGTLRDVAEALRISNLDRAEAALQRARAMDDRVGELREALDSSYGSIKLSPPRRRVLGHLGYYATATGQLDLAVRNTRVLARAAKSLVRSDKSTPPQLPDTILELSQAVEALDAYLGEQNHPVDTRGLALEAAGKATAVLVGRKDLETSVVVGQVRSTAVDLLQASGMNYSEAVQALDEIAIRSAQEVQQSTG